MDDLYLNSQDSDIITDAQSYWSGFSDENSSDFSWEKSLSHSCSDTEDVDTDDTLHITDDDIEEDTIIKNELPFKKKKKL